MEVNMSAGLLLASYSRQGTRRRGDLFKCQRTSQPAAALPLLLNKVLAFMDRHKQSETDIEYPVFPKTTEIQLRWACPKPCAEQQNVQ